MRTESKPSLEALAPGLEGAAKAVVEKAMLAPVVGTGAIAVYSTPSLTILMEQAAVDCVEHLLPAGQASLGVWLELSHTAPTPLGWAVSARATLVAVERRKLEFRIEASNGIETIGEARHTRVIVDVARFETKVAAMQPPES